MSDHNSNLVPFAANTLLFTDAKGNPTTTGSPPITTPTLAEVLAAGNDADNQDIVNLNEIADGFGHLAMSIPARYLFDQSNQLSIDWQDKLLYDASLQVSLDFQNRILKNQIGASSIDYNTCLMFDQAALVSEDYHGRLLYDDNNLISINWLNRLLQDAAGQNSIDYSNRDMFDSSNFLALTYENRELHHSDGTPGLSWGDPGFINIVGGNDLYFGSDGVNNLGQPADNRPNFIYIKNGINLDSLVASSVVLADSSKNLVSDANFSFDQAAQKLTLTGAMLLTGGGSESTYLDQTGTLNDTTRTGHKLTLSFTGTSGKQAVQANISGGGSGAFSSCWTANTQTVSVGNDLGGHGNFGGFFQSFGATGTGLNMGSANYADSATVSLGASGSAGYNGVYLAGAVYVGLHGRAKNTGGNAIGIHATLEDLGTYTPPSITCALLADNKALAADIIRARDNGSDVFRILDGGLIGTNQTAAASVAPVGLTAKMPIYDQTGALVGYIPIYTSIT